MFCLYLFVLPNLHSSPPAIFHRLEMTRCWTNRSDVCASAETSNSYYTQQCEDISIFKNWSKWSKVFQNISHTFYLVGQLTSSGWTEVCTSKDKWSAKSKIYININSMYYNFEMPYIYWMYSGRLDRSVYKQGQVVCPTVECTVEKGGDGSLLPDYLAKT